MSHYPPKHHLENNFENVVRVIRRFPLATVISSGEGDILVTHLPLIYKAMPEGPGKLIGHIDRNNPQWRFMQDAPVKVIFNGPDVYISPSYYTTAQLPTWNYIKVHLDGKCSIMDSNEEVKRSMIEMTDQMERNVSDYRIKPDDARMSKMINYVVGFEIEITGWEGRFKLSQDKIEQDRMNARKALTDSNGRHLNDFIEEIYEHHHNNKIAE